MDNITIYCQDGESFAYSKGRLFMCGQSFEENEFMIPRPKEDVLLFLNFLDTLLLPTMKPDHDKEKILISTILDIAQYCGLKDGTVPGKCFLMDSIYENMEKEFNVTFTYLCDFADETNLNIYDYQFCKFVIQHWKLFLTYGLFMNNVTIKKKQIAKLLDTYKETQI